MMRRFDRIDLTRALSFFSARVIHHPLAGKPLFLRAVEEPDARAFRRILQTDFSDTPELTVTIKVALVLTRAMNNPGQRFCVFV